MKILVLLSRVPYPIEKGDKLRAFHQIRCLSKTNEIVLVALSESKIHPEAEQILKAFCSEIHILPIGKLGMVWNVIKAFLNKKPLQVGYFYRNSVKKQIDQIIFNTKPDHIYCQLIRVSEYIKNIKTPKTLDYQDTLSVGVKRRAEASTFLPKMVFLMEYKRLLRYEHDIFDKFLHKTIISIPDRDFIQHPSKKGITVIPNGVDSEYFYPVKKPKTFDIVFTGNMGYPPNIDAARFLAEEILPLVLKVHPETKLMLAGATPHPKVLALQSQQVTVTGWLSDIRDSYSSSLIFIAPMRIGCGLQNKLLEAMSMGLPCITSELANQALGAKPNEEILVGVTADEFAKHIIRLLQDVAFAETLAKNGHAFVQKTFSWENSAQQLEKLFKS
jgi:sugar transferase (PEP-CTERM/EpsH1 system associated)